MTDLSREEMALTKAAGLVRDAHGELNTEVGKDVSVDELLAENDDD